MTIEGFKVEFLEDGLWLDGNLRITKEGGRIKITVFESNKVDLRIMGLNQLKCKNCGGLVYGPENKKKEG